MTSTHRRLGFHSLIRAAIVLGFAVFIAFLVNGGHIELFIAPRMILYVKISAIGLYLIGAYQLYSAYRYFFGKPVSCDCEHPPSGSLWKHAMIYGLFVFPLLLGFMLPNTTMGTAVAARKGMNLSASSSGRISAPLTERPADNSAERAEEDTAEGNSAAPTPAPASASESESESAPAPAPALAEISDEELNRLFQTDEYNEDFARLAKQLYRQDVIEVKEELYMEILTAIDLFLDQFQEKTVEIGGFVYREPEMNEKQFVVGRFAMSCCSADALPYGVLVEYDKAGHYPNDTWLKLRGKIGKTTYQDQEIMVFKPEMIQITEQPDSPYVYPNYDF